MLQNKNVYVCVAEVRVSAYAAFLCQHPNLYRIICSSKWKTIFRCLARALFHIRPRHLFMAKYLCTAHLPVFLPRGNLIWWMSTLTNSGSKPFMCVRASLLAYVSVCVLYNTFYDCLFIRFIYRSHLFCCCGRYEMKRAELIGNSHVGFFKYCPTIQLNTWRYESVYLVHSRMQLKSQWSEHTI